MRGFALTALIVSLAATSAWAQETVATAPRSGAYPPGPQNAGPPPLNTVASDRPANDGPVRDGPCGPVTSDAPGADMAPHGDVTVGVGTGGYREFGASMCKPLPGGGALAIAVDQGQESWGRR